MHRTQIYLHDTLFEGLKLRARATGVSMSEFIRQSLESQMVRDPAGDARAFFDQLKPLESFKNVDSDAFVRASRSKSRVLRGSQSS